MMSERKRKYDKWYTEVNRERLREYRKKYYKTWRVKNYDRAKEILRDYIERHANEKEYQEKRRESKRKSYYKNKHKHPYKSKPLIVREAYNEYRKALCNGILKRKPCVVCGNKKTAGHHEDYNNPLDVIWFCRKHHTKYHAGLIKIEEVA